MTPPKASLKFLTADDIKEFRTEAFISEMMKKALTQYDKGLEPFRIETGNKLDLISVKISELYGNGSGTPGFLEKARLEDKRTFAELRDHIAELKKTANGRNGWIDEQRKDAEEDRIRREFMMKLLRKTYLVVKFAGSGIGLLLLRYVYVHFAHHAP